MPPEIVGEYLRYGVLGASVIVLALVVLWLAREVKRLQEARLTDIQAAANLRIEDQKLHVADNLKFADAISQIIQQFAVREEANKARWDTVEKINEALVGVAQIADRMYQRQDQILTALEQRPKFRT